MPFLASETEYSREVAPDATIFSFVGVIFVLGLWLLWIHLDDTISLQQAIVSLMKRASMQIYTVRVMFLQIGIEVIVLLETAFDFNEIAIAKRLKIPIVCQDNRKHGHGVPRNPE